MTAYADELKFAPGMTDAETVSVTVLWFARLGEVAGRDQETVRFCSTIHSSEVLRWAALRLPTAAGLIARSRLAVGHSFVSGPLALENGCEIAVIPPVSGG